MSHWWWSSQRKPLHMIQRRHPPAASPSPSRPATRCCWTPPGPPHPHSRSGYLSLTLTKSSSTWKIVNYHYQAQYFETFGGWHTYLAELLLISTTLRLTLELPPKFGIKEEKSGHWKLERELKKFSMKLENRYEGSGAHSVDEIRQRIIKY